MANLDPNRLDEMLALYVTRALNPEDQRAIEAKAANDATFKNKLDQLQDKFNKALMISSRPASKNFFNQIEQRIQALEAADGNPAPPIVNSQSKAADYAPWIGQRLDALRARSEEFVCVPLAKTEDTETYLVKITVGIPQEVHTTEIERILILEGTCEFLVGDELTAYGPGSQLRIPLHKVHEGWITSPEPCYVVLQRTQVSAY
jgi:hypothetical protein